VTDNDPELGNSVTADNTRCGQHRDRVAARRGRNIGVVAAARELIRLVFYGLRDGHVRALAAPAATTPKAAA